MTGPVHVMHSPGGFAQESRYTEIELALPLRAAEIISLGGRMVEAPAGLFFPMDRRAGAMRIHSHQVRAGLMASSTRAGDEAPRPSCFRRPHSCHEAGSAAQTLSISAAIPWPPDTHSVAIP